MVPKFHLYAERSYCETSYGRCCWFHRSRFIVVGVIIKVCTGRSLCCSQIKSSSMSHCPMRAMPLPTSMIASSNWRTRHGAELVYGLEDHRRYGRLFCHLRATCRRQCLAKDDVTINLQDDVLTLEARVGRHSSRTLTGSVVSALTVRFRGWCSCRSGSIRKRYRRATTTGRARRPKSSRRRTFARRAARELHGSAAAFAMLPAWGKDYCRTYHLHRQPSTHPPKAV